MIQVEPEPGARAAHVKQAAFLFDLLLALLGGIEQVRFADKRKDSLVASGDVHRIEFEPLRHVNRHQRHAGLRLLHLLVRIRQERNFLQELIQSLVGIFLFELAERVHHFVQVSSAFVRRRVVFLLEVFPVERVPDDTLRDNRESLARAE